MENPIKTDIMRKLILSLAAVFCVLTVSAQTEKWSVGGRVGSGFQAVAAYNGLGDVAGKPFYLEGRFGMSWCNAGASLMADFTAIAAWRCFEFGDCSAGGFFSDFGCGLNVGGREHNAYVGPCGLARVGFKFADAPVSLSLDWTPVFGAEVAYWGKQTVYGYEIPGGSTSQFYAYGLANIGVTCTFNF